MPYGQESQRDLTPVKSNRGPNPMRLQRFANIAKAKVLKKEEFNNKRLEKRSAIHRAKVASPEEDSSDYSSTAEGTVTSDSEGESFQDCEFEQDSSTESEEEDNPADDMLAVATEMCNADPLSIIGEEIASLWCGD